MTLELKASKQANYWEYLIPALMTISLLIACFITSGKKYFWNDELLSFYLLNDPSFTHMLAAWSDKFNQAPPLYFILGWLWAKIFGATELSLRLFSSLSLSLAFAIIWIVLRRTYNFWAVTIGTLSIFCLSQLVLYHNAEARMYGLFAAGSALCLLLFDTINRKQKCSWQLLGINALAHATLVMIHLYGVFYSAAFFAAFILRDRYLKLLRWDVYLSPLIGWLVIIPLLPTLINQSNNSAKWFSQLGPTTLLGFFTFSWLSTWVLLIVFISAFFYIIQAASSKETVGDSYRNYPDLKSEVSLLILAGTFIAIPIITWIVPKIINQIINVRPILGERYIIPTITIVWSILLTYLISRIFPSLLYPAQPSEKFIVNLQKLTLLILTLVLLLHPIYQARKNEIYSHKPGLNDSSYGYVELPIAMEAGHDFLPRFHYSSNPRRYFHILDWDTAVKNVKSIYATGDYVHIEALNRNYPFIQSVQSKDFLKRYKRFLVLNEEDQKWFEYRLENNPEYKVKKLGVEQGANGLLEVFLVEEKNKSSF